MKNDDQLWTQLWIDLARSHSMILRKVEAALKSEGLPNLSWYDVLLEVERGGPEGLRPFELEERMLLPQYSVSRLVERIGKAGFIEIKPFSQDGRGKRILITMAGQKVRRDMWKVYGPALEKIIGKNLTKKEIQDAHTILGKLSGR